jgi:hypothetical protein
MTHIFRCSLLSDTKYNLIEATLQKKVQLYFSRFIFHAQLQDSSKNWEMLLFFKFISTFLI